MDWLNETYAFIAFAGAIGGVGTAWGTTRSTIASTKWRITELKAAFENHVEDDLEHQKEAIDRLARLETKIDILISSER